jgi:hypothetical protein
VFSSSRISKPCFPGTSKGELEQRGITLIGVTTLMTKTALIVITSYLI